jgi:hypothetical protein
MKVFNVTDMPSRSLEQQGLVNVSVKVGTVVIPPGGSAVLRGSHKERSELMPLVRRGAVVVDELPPAYAAKKGLMVSGVPKKVEVKEPPKPALRKFVPETRKKSK